MEIHVASTSSRTAECDPIVLRETERVRLVFLPELVKNEANPQACVRGTFVYQRKNATAEWAKSTEYSLSSLKSGEGYQLELRSSELFHLGQSVRSLYELFGQRGIPRGKSVFVKIEAGLARLFKLEQSELLEFFEEHSGDATAILSRLLGWLAESPEALARFSELSLSELPSVSALLGLSSLKSALQYWSDNQTNDDEEFWQEAFAERAYILSQAFAYPVIVVKDKAYVGGKQFDYRHGKIADFLMAAESTNAALLVELKTPKTPILGLKYRDGVYPLSYELTSAIAQVLNYQRNLSLYFHSLTADTEKRLTIGQTRCLVVAGNSSELSAPGMKESFELQRDRLQGVTVVTYDELFLKLKRFVEIVEPSGKIAL